MGRPWHGGLLLKSEGYGQVAQSDSWCGEEIVGNSKLCSTADACPYPIYEKANEKRKLATSLDPDKHPSRHPQDLCSASHKYV